MRDPSTCVSVLPVVSASISSPESAPFFSSPSCSQGAEEDNPRISLMHSGVSVCLCNCDFIPRTRRKLARASVGAGGGSAWASVKQSERLYLNRNQRRRRPSRSAVPLQAATVAFHRCTWRQNQGYYERSVMLCGKINVINCAV